MGLATKTLFQRRRYFDATSHHYHVDVVRRTLEKNVSHISSHHITFKAEVVSHTGDKVENVFVKQLCKLFIAIYFLLLGVQNYSKREK